MKRKLAPRGASIAEKLEFYSIPVTECGCHVWTASLGTSGYGQINVEGRPLGTHRVAWEQKNGKVPIGKHVLHKCDVRTCVNPDHLFLGTHADNMADMMAKGRANGGCRNSENARSAVLSIEEVKKIRGMDGSCSKIATLFGVNASTIWAVKCRKTWASV